MSDVGSAFIQVAAGFHPAAWGWAGELTLAGAQERYVAPICPRNSNSRSGRDLAGAGLEVTDPEYISILVHTAAHYSTDIIGSTALTTFHCTAQF